MSEQIADCPVCGGSGTHPRDGDGVRDDWAYCHRCVLMLRLVDWSRLSRAAALLRAAEAPESAIREALAAYAHDEAWAGWLRYQFGKGALNEDGTLTLPAWAVERWHRQMNTAYADLPEGEKASDRIEADRMLAIVAQIGDHNAE